jgi:acetolactate synthase-1/2/3 large subunit
MRELLAAAPSFAAPADWIRRCDGYRAAYPVVGPEHEDRDGYINSYKFMSRLCDFLHRDLVIVTDAGTALLSGHQVLRLTPPQRLFTSLGLGEMGYGLPAAIGASFARGRGEVLCLNCDGGMMMNLQELQTVAHHRLPVKILVFNNDGYLMIKHTQNAMFQGRHYAVAKDSGISCPDFGALAGVFRMEAFSIATWADVDAVLPAFLGCDGPAICEVRMHPQQPMAPKLSLAIQPDGSLVSPPLEDLSPLLPREELKRNMVNGLHPKSMRLEVR